MTKIKAGSKVKAKMSVTRSFAPRESIEAGKVYTVNRIGGIGDEVYLEGYTQYFDISRFELVQEVDGFKVGDIVVVVYGGAGVSSRDIGKTATIIAVNPDGGTYDKLTLDGKDFTYPSYDNKRAIPCATKSVKKVEVTAEVVDGFKVGDRVKIVDSGWGIALTDVGKITTVTEVKRGGKVGGSIWADYTVAVDATGFAYNYQNRTSVGCNPRSLQKVADPIDFTKPLFTMEGTPVELLTTEGRDPKFPVLAYEGKATQTSKFNKDGISSLGVARRNLTNQPPKLEVEVVEYVNVYKENGTLKTYGCYKSRNDADIGSSHDRVGCIKRVVKLVEGQFDA